jgi:MFS family permease
MAALVNPLALAIIMVSFDKEERPKALGLYGAALGGAAGLGTIVISFLNQQAGWRATFGGLFAVVYGINQAAAQGFGSPVVLVPVGIGAVLLVLLVLYSKRTTEPALRISLFQNKTFAVGVLLFLMMGFSSMGPYMGFSSMGPYFQLSTYLQSLQRVSPIQAALTLLPYTLSLLVFGILAGGWVGRFPNRLLIAGGLALMMLALAALALWLNPAVGFWVYLVPLVLLGAGFSIANIPRMNAVLATAPPELAGAASATNNASLQLGSSLGIAVMGALFQGIARNAYTSDLTELGLGTAEIERSVEVLAAWLKANAGDWGSRSRCGCYTGLVHLPEKGRDTLLRAGHDGRAGAGERRDGR